MTEKSCCAAQRDEKVISEPVGAFNRVFSGKLNDMVLIDVGTFLMGTDDSIGYEDDGEGPVREIALDPFYIDTAPVTNRQFSDFVNATGYRTEADDFGWSFVFHAHVPKKITGEPVPGVPWWRKVDRANWRRPEGPGSNVKKRMENPVVHVSVRDARAYCEWVGKRLPTEAEWEAAGRGGLVQKRYAWGDELTPDGKHQCNIWQGDFPSKDSADDGYAGTSPVQAFPANGFGIYSVAGNVWEWCHDYWSPFFHRNGPDRNPTGPANGNRHVMRGGSFLCHSSYCNRYRVAARTSNTSDSSTANMGFRCVRDV